MESLVVRFIIEVLGKPEEIVKKTLKQVAKTISERYELIDSHYSDVESVKDSDLLSAFVELEFEVKDFEQLFLAVIDFGPSVVELVEPDEVTISNTELQSALTELVTKFHSLSRAIQYLKVENVKLKKESATNK